MRLASLLLSLLLYSYLSAAAGPSPLRTCWRRQAQPLQHAYLAARYQETLAQLEHSWQPWQATTYTGTGRTWSRADGFLKADTLRQGAKTYFSRTQFTPGAPLFRDYGDQELTPVGPETTAEFALQAARYSPAPLIQYFVTQRVPPGPESTGETAVYQATLGRAVVRLHIRRQDGQLGQVTTLSPDDMLGDVTTTYTYADYARLGQLRYPRRITVSKYNGRLTDQITLGAAELSPTAPSLLTAPAGSLPAPPAAAAPTVRVTHHGRHLHLLELPHTDDRVLVVEFDSFLLVAEAPLSSANGELIIREARRLAPGKPIRYFVAGHYHPHYLGGVRPFVHAGATVLTTDLGQPYVQYLASAPHTLRPDSLQLRPRPLHTELIQTSKTLAEGGFEMQLHFIGGQSQHTADYLIYYFPTEKLLFEDDLAGIPRQGAPRKASARQAGLYQAIRQRHLDVQTIVQSWPVQESGVKTIFSFEELEQAMTVK